MTSSSSIRIGNFNPSIADFSSSFNVSLDDWNMAYIVFSFAFFFVGTFIMRVVEARSVLHVLSTATVEMDIVVYALVIWAWVVRFRALLVTRFLVLGCVLHWVCDVVRVESKRSCTTPAQFSRSSS